MGKDAAAEQVPDDYYHYWLRWQVFVCALIFLLPALLSMILIIKSRSTTRTPPPPSQQQRGHRASTYRQLWLPCWTTLHPTWLLYYRALAFLTMTFFLYQIVRAFGFFIFFFYTQWTFALVAVYFALATIISAHGCWIHSKTPFAQSGDKDKLLKKNLEEESKNDEYVSSTSIMNQDDGGFIKCHAQVPIDQQPGFWGVLMQCIYYTCAGAVMLTDIVFWCLLLPFMSGEHFQLTMLMACMHSVNAVFLILDSTLNSLPFSWFGFVYFVLWSSSYVVFQWALHVCCITWWPYPFLDLSNAWAPIWYLALALVHVPCYGSYVLLAKGKDSIFSRMFPHTYLRISAEKKQKN
ncbi:uncharacterized protein [Coffea arabica]|uniref:Uncharacterized protein isoform X1 n=1 Tax=Coffea arabica TaxID=13443 RepID=A0A6P6VBY2_COFAR|nr:uncharacterized protein LOC113719186 isoform X1 [Coffea arabica]